MAKGMKLYNKSIAMLLLFAAFFFLGTEEVYGDNDFKSILVLNSYQQGLPWTDDEMAGILDVFNNEDENFPISVEYMDWKNFAAEENLKQLRTRLGYKYKHQKIDIIITTDDAALEFALKNRKEMFSDAPVIFCGVNIRGTERIISDETRVTGVIEKVDPTDTIAAALEMNPNIKQIYLVFDQSESGQSTGELSINAIRKIAPSIHIVTLNDSNMENIFEEVRQAPKDSIVISTTYSTNTEGVMVEFEYFQRKLSQSSTVPVFNLYDFGIDNGAIGGSMLSGRLQGEEAAKMALKILHGEEITNMPFNMTNTTRYLFDYKELQRFNIDVNSIPKGSEIVNKPFSFFEEHKHFIIPIIIIFSLLLIIIAMLLFYLKKISRMKEQLYTNHKELTMLYDELIIADSKLNHQYNNLLKVQSSLNSSDNRFTLLFDKMLNGFFIIEPIFNTENKLMDMSFIKANPGFYKQTGLPIADIIGKTWSEVFGFPSKELSIYQNLLLTGKSERLETYYPENGVYYMVNMFLISDNQIGVVFDNITAYKKAIKEVRLLNTDLEKRVSGRTEELQEAINELESFTFTVSHDLKAPLRAVDGYTQILLEDLGSKLDDDTMKILYNIRTISRDTIEMVNKLLQYSKASRALLDKEEVNVEKKIREVFNDLQLTQPDRAINLIIETGLPNIYVDRFLFRQLLQNILSNAIKFTKNKENAIISVGCTLTQDEYVFYIKDNGVGFDMKYSAKLFGIFQRLHSNDEFEGSGIGLVTVKKIIEKHGGKVWIEGKVDIGTIVFFTLPFR